jgi:hypothetical protein
MKATSRTAAPSLLPDASMTALLRRLAAAVVCTLFLGAPAIARGETSAPSPSATSVAPAASGREKAGGALYLFLGHSGWDTRALDARLASLGYGSFSQDPGSGGFGLRAWVKECECMGGLEFQLAIASANADQGRSLSLVAGQFMLHAGRILWAKGNLRTYAMLGVGYGSTTLTLDPGGLPPRARNPLGFADGSSGVSNFALALQALVGVDYLVPFDGKARGFNGIVVGLRAGYNAQPLVSSWSASSGSGSTAASYPVDLPRVADDGAFVHLVFGDLALMR